MKKLLLIFLIFFFSGCTAATPKKTTFIRVDTPCSGTTLIIVEGNGEDKEIKSIFEGENNRREVKKP